MVDIRRYIPEQIYEFDPFNDGDHIHGDVRSTLPFYEDAFGNLVSQGTTSEADLASHYDYSPERYRVFVDGSRKFIQYNGEPTQFTDNEDSFSLKPQSDGEVVEIKTAERYRYVVQYVFEWSLAFQTNQSLNSGDVWAVALGDADLENSTDDTPGPAATGWIVYQNSSDADDEATLAEYRNGSEKDATTVTFSKLPQTWGRAEGKTNWYNVGETGLTETYTEVGDQDSRQRNDILGAVATNDGKGPERGNHQITAAVKTGSTSAGNLTLELGSIGARTLGDVTATTRAKTFPYSLDITVTGSYEPLLAIRGDPDRDNVNTQINKIEILEFTGNDDSFALIQSFDSSKVQDTNGNALTDSDFSTPPELAAINSVIQTSTAVEQIPDSGGTQSTSVSDPGGFQLGYASRYSTGTGSGSERGATAELVQKRNIPNSDVAVLLGKSPSTGALKGQTSLIQEW